MNRRLAVVLLAAALAAGWAISRGKPSAVTIGQPAPPFQLATLAGSMVSPSNLRGRVVLLNFWASWCSDCREEFPVLEDVYRRLHAQGFDIVAPSVDANGRRAVLPFVARFEPSFTICLADPRTAQAYGVRELPTSFLIDAQGIVRRRYVGAVSTAELENDILKTLPPRRRS